MADEQTTQDVSVAPGAQATEQTPNSGVTEASADVGDNDLSPDAQKMLDDAAKGIPPPIPGRPRPEVKAVAVPAPDADMPEEKAPELTPEQLHTAQRSGWTPQQVQDLVAAMGDKAGAYLDGLKAQVFDRISAQNGTQQQAAPVQLDGFDLAQPFTLGIEPVKEGEMVTAYKIGDTQYEPEYVDKVLAPQVKALEGMRQSVVRMQAEQMFRETDQFFQKIAPEYGEMFGTERMGALDWKGPKGQARMAVIQKAKTLLDGYHSGGQYFIGIEDCLDEAKQIVAKDFHKKAAMNAVRNRQGQFTQRPSQRQTPEKFQSPREKAIATVDAKIAEIKASGGLD